VRPKINKVVNPDFSQGKKAPRGWVWTAKPAGARWLRHATDCADQTPGITIESNRARGSAYWSQAVACKPEQFYRVEATVTCDLAASGDADGIVLRVEPWADGRLCGESRTTPGLHHADEPIAVRTYFQAPAGVRRLRVGVGVVDATGTARVEHVRFIPILEPDEMSHVLAVPPPLSAYPRRKPAQTVCVCSDQAADRPLTRLLAGFFGESMVLAIPSVECNVGSAGADAVFLPDPLPPPSIRTLERLIHLASDRLVVVSLPAFAKLTRGIASVRRVEQLDDPIHAKVTFANYATPGFALNDTFAYAWAGRAIGSFVQNHFRRTEALRNFCRKHGFETMLVSMCERDVTSDRPVCLYKPTGAGGLLVLDVEPVEATPSTYGEPNLAMHLLLSILGSVQVGLGQYTVPVREEASFRDSIREMGSRFEQFAVHDADVPVEQVHEQLVTIGREDESYGLPLQPKPVLLVRSGVCTGDMESVYGAFAWFKQLVRPPPYACPYADPLASRFRLAWVPCVAPWIAGDGWRRSAAPSAVPMELESDGAAVAALIDIVSCPVNSVRVVFCRDDDAFQHCAAWLPRLATTFPAGRYFAYTVADGEPFTDRRRYAWRGVEHGVQVVVDPNAFGEPIHRDAMAAGGQVIRLELPGCDADFVSHSIQRTDLAATVLEQVIGLQYGMIAVNRSAAPVHFDGFPPVGPWEPLIVDARDPILQSRTCQVG
jgi:hypothetical protein